MSIVSSFCFSCPRGSGVIFSVYHVSYQPPSIGKLHTRTQLWFLRFVLGAKWQRGKTQIICLSTLVWKRRDLISLSSSINAISLTCTVDDH